MGLNAARHGTHIHFDASGEGAGTHAIRQIRTRGERFHSSWIVVGMNEVPNSMYYYKRQANGRHTHASLFNGGERSLKEPDNNQRLACALKILCFQTELPWD